MKLCGNGEACYKTVLTSVEFHRQLVFFLIPSEDITLINTVLLERDTRGACVFLAGFGSTLAGADLQL